MKIPYSIFLLSLLLLAFGCDKSSEPVLVPDNNAPPYDGISTLKVENYLNRMYIDLLGREPLDAEMAQGVEDLRAGNLGQNARRQLVKELQSDTSFVAGDSSYKHAYYQRMYELAKVRMIEGASNDIIYQEIALIEGDILRDSLAGNWAGVEQKRAEQDKLWAIMHSKIEYREKDIWVGEVYKRMLNNAIYDEINMNSFNFVNASFDNLFFRYPTQDEFNRAFQVIEYNVASTIFGQSCQNKEEYIDILVDSREFHEGMIRWAYNTLLARDPSASEVQAAMSDFYVSKDFQKVQLDIIVTDEYAGF